MKTFAIGDIHGGLLGLKEVLSKLPKTTGSTFILLGDYVDGWSQTKETVDFLIEFSSKENCIFIKGNHDVWCYEWLEKKETNITWYNHGGKSTMASYEGSTEDEIEKHILFFSKMKDYFIDTKNRLFIHAGFSSMHGPASEVYSSNYSWDRTLWEMALTMDKRIKKDSKLYPKRLLLFNEIYIGHTPTLNYDIEIPMQGCNVWNLDTGAGFYGKLTCMDIETKEFWQSEKLIDLYPNEKGRNKI